jgi:hypothetical protein
MKPTRPPVKPVVHNTIPGDAPAKGSLWHAILQPGCENHGSSDRSKTRAALKDTVTPLSTLPLVTDQSVPMT